MDARKVVEENLRTCVSKAMKLGILVNPRISGDFFKDRKKISSKYTRFIDEADYLENYFKKYEQGEFFATFDDGAFLQINYEFDIQSKKTSYLEKMNLCYLPPVTEDSGLKNEYIRIDYNNSPTNSFFHACAHVHIGFRNTIRIPIDEVLLFSEFLEMILYLFYPEQFKAFCTGIYKTTNTEDKAQSGKLTKNKILTKELQKSFYWKTFAG